MSIVSEIERIKSNIANAYNKCQEKGATMPTTKNSENLPSCISSITGGGNIDINNGYVTDGLLFNLSGLVAPNIKNYWLDSVNGARAVLYNSPTYDSANKCYTFNGTNQYGTIYMNGAGGDFTLEVYYKQDTSGNFDVMLGQGRGYYPGFGIVNASGVHYCWVTTSTGKANALPESDRISLITGKKLYTRLSRETSTAHFAIKGSDVDITKSYTASAIAIDETEFSIGKSGYNPSTVFYSNANIYAIRLYNRKLTAAEVQQNYEQDVLNFGV